MAVRRLMRWVAVAALAGAAALGSSAPTQAQEPNESRETAAGPLSNGQVISGVIASLDRDYFRFCVAADDTDVSFRVSNTTPPGRDNPGRSTYTMGLNAWILDANGWGGDSFHLDDDHPTWEATVRLDAGVGYLMLELSSFGYPPETYEAQARSGLSPCPGDPGSIPEVTPPVADAPPCNSARGRNPAGCREAGISKKLALRDQIAKLGADVLNFLILDDVRALSDPNVSLGEKALIVASWFAPIPGGKVAAKLAARIGERLVPSMARALERTGAILGSACLRRAVSSPLVAAAAPCGKSGKKAVYEGVNAGMTKTLSEQWKALHPFKGKTRTNGAKGKKREYYEWDHYHRDIEVWDHKMRHLGTMDPISGKMIKGPSGHKPSLRPQLAPR